MPDKSLKVPFNGHDFFISITDGDMVSLNQIHEIVGSPENQSPSQWISLPSTVLLLESIDNENVERSHIIETKRGEGGGTLAHWQLALSYAQYLSSELHIAVNQVFKERLEEMIDPELGLSRSQERARKAWRAQGKSEEWIAKREQNKNIHGVYVETLIEHKVKPGQEIGHCTNQIYRGLFLKDKSGIEESLRKNNPNLPKSVNIRDYAKLSSLAAISLAEALTSEKIEEVNANGVKHCAEISFDKASSVRVALDDSRSKDNALQSHQARKSEVTTEKNMQNIKNLKNALHGK